MKKFYFLVILVLVGLESFAQAPTDNPVLPRIYEDGYSIEQIKEFALGNRQGINPEYASSYRQKLLSIINEGLRRSGEYVNVNNGKPVDESWVEWIYDQVERIYNDSLPAGYRNTWHNGNQVSWTNKKQKKYYGPLDRFVYGVCIIKLDKPSCANLVPDYSLLGYIKQIEQKKSNQRTEPEKTKEQENTLVDFGSEDKIKKLQERAKFVADSIAKAIAKAKENAISTPKTKKLRADRTWAGRNLGLIISTGTGIIAGAAGFVFPSDGYKWYHLFPIGSNPHGSMSGGRSFDETETSTGSNSTDSGGSTGGRGN